MYWPHDPAHPVTKVCTRCGEEKPFPLFPLRYDSGRRRNVCRACHNEAARRYYGENAERLRAAGRHWHAANRERALAAGRRFYKANAARLLAEHRRWYAENQEQCRAAKRRYYRANAPRLRAEMRQRHAAQAEARRLQGLPEPRKHRTREQVRDTMRRYRRRHPGKVAARRATQALRALGILPLAAACADCGGKATDHHHLDYRNPFDVVSLCHRCHMRRHLGPWRRGGGGPVKYPEEYRGAD
jgi:hypothetical protein